MFFLISILAVWGGAVARQPPCLGAPLRCVAKKQSFNVKVADIVVTVTVQQATRQTDRTLTIIEVSCEWKVNCTIVFC